MKARRFLAHVPGLALAGAVAAVAYAAGRAAPIIGGPVFALVLGILVGLAPRPARFDPGQKTASKKVLQAAVVLLGFGMDFGQALRIGSSSIVVMLTTLCASFAIAFLASRALRVRGKAVGLIAIGTAICGASAIAAAAPAMDADDDETAYAISTIFAFNVAAVLIFPYLGRLLGLSPEGFGVWAGTAVNDTSSVIAVGIAFGPEALEAATVVKLTRTLFIVPVVLALSARTAWLERRPRAAGEEPRSGSSLGRGAAAFPWFVVGFVAASMLGTTGIVPAGAAKALASAGKALVLVAMAGVGLGVKPAMFKAAGWRPLALGLACWAAVACSSLAAQAALGRW